MLDNIVTENCMAAMPIEILADAKANSKTNKRSEDKIQINKINQSAAVKTNKTKTILNWLKNTTSSTPNHTNTPNTTTTTTTTTTNNKIRKDNLNNYKRFDKIIQQQQQQQLNSFNTCTCPKENQSQNKQIVKLNETKEDDTLREFRGVQTLRHFWNKRITANRESALKAKGSKKHITKSVSCLVNVINDSTEVSTSPTSVSSSPPPIYYTESELLRARKYRALSLHDCSRNSIDFEEISLSDIDIQKHLEKDNFYKYKTAEQASKLRQLSEHSINRKLSNGIIVSVNQKPERFDWLKRHDKFSRKKSIELTFSPLKEITRIPNNCDNSKQLIAAISATNNNDIVINEHEMHSQQAQADTAFLPTATATALGQKSAEIGSTNINTNTSSETSTPTLTAANSPQHHNAAAVNERRPATRKDSSKTLTSASSISRDSSTTSLAASACSHKTLVKRNSSARKYSFKTHARSYHVPRKMHSNKDVGSAGGAGIIVNPSNSLVAKLTQQFNEIIQKDKTFLEEIKRKNGVLMTHKGHVYKVVDTASLNRNQAQGTKTQDANSANQALAGGKGCSSTVQKNIKKFESELKGLKPKVPLKSIKVLKKSNELVINKTMIISARFNANKLEDNKTEKEDCQVEIKPHTLEMVQEETKVPLESHDKNQALQNSKEPTESEQVASKENEVIKDGNSSMEDIFKSNDFLVVVPPKIDSVIYKSIHRTKQQRIATAVEVAEEALESFQAPKSLLINESHIAPSSTQRLDQETLAKQNENETQSQNENKSSCGLSESKANEISLQTEANTLPKPLAIEPTATNLLAESESCNKSIDENLSSSETLEEDDKKKRKHKYAKIYEKLRFFAPFSHNHKKQKLNATGALSPEAITNLNIDTELENAEREKENDCSENPHLLPKGEYTPMRSSQSKQDECESAENVYSIICESEAKLLDALEQVDKKLQHLSHDTEKVLESDDYGQPLIANSSFLHHTKDNLQSINNTRPTTVIQAVNVSLVNALEGEQMIMEQKELQKEDNLKEREENLKKTAEEEPFYEPICVVKTTTEHKTEPASNNSISKDFAKATENSQPIKQEKVEEKEEEEEDIYQTVEEVKTIKTLTSQDLDGYEPIENPDDAIIPVKFFTDSLNTKPAHFDGYEEYTPAVEMIQPAPATVAISGRKVTDQLPDLPKPKRILPKSPIPSRAAPKPPLLRNNATESLNNMPTCHESHYYGVEENIYDTIKGSHCYETLQCVGNKLQNSPPLLRTKNSDCLSLTSNCYESISHYKRTNVMSQHSGGSSTGSTLTISSENKTNSLYEDSLISSLHYASKRIYHMNNQHHHANTQHHHNEIGKSSTEVNSVNGYGGSMGRKSDTSDEWTDVTDNENEDTENKLQIIIVRERSKTHKSPDWSRRVRDKRQRKSKSCIEDDDPDHFYEQLSPLTLSKRHSLFEQNRTGSLQRNQEPVRVSKRGKQMSYSAHALGQHISDDSFDSDTDDYYESEHFKNSHNDSGVDIRNTKLPDPPSASNHMYSFVKKFKNFIVNKKSPNSSTKQNGSQQKIYDTSAQFYAGSQYEGKTPPQATAASLQAPDTKELSTSEKNLILAQSAVESTQQPINTLTTPRKSKSGKSLRSRIRKSLVGFDTKQLSALTPTRSTFYIEDPTNDENNGQLDSGFSEKALSGELPTSASTPTSTSTSETQKLSTLGRKAKKEAKLANSQRRRTTIGIRPHEPPPPPPPDNNCKPRRQSNTSWYAECGVFKNGTTNLVNDDSTVLNGQGNSSGSGSVVAGSTWYEEAGLYQTSGLSVASSSGSSGVSTSNEGGPSDEMSHSMFSNEPLYQIYSAAKLEAISRDMQDESSTDGYEEIGDRYKNGNAAEVTRKSLRPSALQLVEPKSGPERTLWSQIPEVINSYIIPTMTSRERALMEAKFEIITSEASYLKSLNLLRTHYMNHPVFRDQNVVSSRDRKSLFSHIVPVHECSEKLLTELESCWQDNIMLIGLSKRIYTVAEKYFHVYVGFCEHQGRMDRTLKQLREGKGLFAQNLELLESSPACCGLSLHSFLMLPMQRITRLPLLIDAVFSKCHPNDDEYENWKMCLAIMNKIVTQCNEAANKSEQAFEIERISRQLEFNPSVIRPLAIAPAGVLALGTKPRYLVKKGELTHLIWRGDDAKLTFGKKFSKTTIFAFLFSDLLVLTKRKAEEQFSVFDYCPRNMLTITSGDLLPQLPTKDLNSQTSKNLILMTLLENHERKTVELLLSCPSVSEQERWLQTMRPPESETPGEKLYEQWDCPQVIAKHVYENNEPDVLNLDVGDVVNVTRKLPDGWYKGERIRDGAVGWFPGSYTEEVNSVHVRARNLKQRHRLLTFTATYLESQKRNK